METLREKCFKELEERGYERDFQIDYENIEDASNILELHAPLDFCIVSQVAEGDSWYEVRYWSHKIQKAVIFNADIEPDYENIEEFVDAMLEIQAEIEAFESTLTVSKP